LHHGLFHAHDSSSVELYDELVGLELFSSVGIILFRLVCNLAAKVDIKSEPDGFFFSELLTLFSFVPSRIEANKLALPA